MLDLFRLRDLRPARRGHRVILRSLAAQLIEHATTLTKRGRRAPGPGAPDNGGGGLLKMLPGGFSMGVGARAWSAMGPGDRQDLLAFEARPPAQRAMNIPPRREPLGLPWIDRAAVKNAGRLPRTAI